MCDSIHIGIGSNPSYRPTGKAISLPSSDVIAPPTERKHISAAQVTTGGSEGVATGVDGECSLSGSAHSRLLSSRLTERDPERRGPEDPEVGVSAGVSPPTSYPTNHIETDQGGMTGP